MRVPTKPFSMSDESVCVVCAEGYKIAAITPCQHVTCNKCALRQRALFKKETCLICRTENGNVIFTEKLNTPYDKIDPPALQNEKYRIQFTSKSARENTMRLLRWYCPLKNCSEKKDLHSFKSLNSHVKTEHKLFYCNICVEHKRAFISELKVYTQESLQHHQQKGDDFGFKGHPNCKFCSSKRFYSDDELFVHLREAHERCHVCDQIDISNPQYFKNYDALSKHFLKQHFVCNVQSCLDQKFVVFRDEFDLRAHMVKEHGNVSGKRVNLYEAAGFGSRLSTVDVNQFANQFAFQKNKQDDSNSLDVKKKRLDERARHYLNYNQEKVDQFKDVNKKYQSSSLSSEKVMEEYSKIFSQSSTADLGILLFELSELFPKNSQKQKNLVKLTASAADDALSEDLFPSLPGSSDSLHFSSNSWSNMSGRRSQPRNQKNSDLFPSLSKSTPTPAKFSAARSTPSPSPSLNKPLYAQPNSRPPAKASLDQFPALPPSQKKQIPRVNPGRSDSGQWGSSSSSSLDVSSVGDSLPSDRKGKKKKQILFHLGV